MQELHSVLDRIGIGRYHLLQSLIVGGVCMADGSEILVSSSVLSALQKAWDLSPLVKALMMSLIFVGVFVGNLIGGSLADIHGRRVVVLGAYVGICVFGALTALAWGPASMMAIRFLFGACFGMGGGPGVALQVECAPASWRGHLLNFNGLFFAVGELYTSMLLLIFMPLLMDPDSNQWRHVTLLSVLPGTIMLPFAFLLLKESPHFLLTQGRSEEALGIVRYIARMNGKEGDVFAGATTGAAQPEHTGPTTATVALPARASASTMPADEGTPLLHAEVGGVVPWQNVRTVLSEEFRWIVIGGAYLCFLSNFLFYGLTYGLPQTFSGMRGELSPALQVLIISCCDIPGVLLSLILIQSKRFGHRDGLVVLAALATLLQLSLMSIDFGAGWHWLGLPSAYLSKYVSSSFFTITYIYLGEVFPSVIRCTGLSICIACGRFGSMLAPVLFELLTTSTNPIGPHASFLMFNSGLCLTAILVVRLFLSFELKNLPLEDLATPAVAGPCAAEAHRERRLSLEGIGQDAEVARAG
mmetsp:Transcript_77217/g.213524  ORF Transcript_77217/g.213524 Transcript_77217/m.213524 type:complete len:528 (+) Transcript_77217:174-1757(+)